MAHELRKKMMLVKNVQWKQRYIFTKYSKNLNISQIIFWLCQMKSDLKHEMLLIRCVTSVP